MSKLNHAPLEAVYFAVTWQLDPAPVGDELVDFGYTDAVGRLADALQGELPIRSQNPFEGNTAQGFVEVYTSVDGAYSTHFMPGGFVLICTGNEYDWDSFKPFIERCLLFLSQSYKKHLIYDYASLRYLDKISEPKYNVGQDPAVFISENFSIRVEDDLAQSLAPARQSIGIRREYSLAEGTELTFKIWTESISEGPNMYRAISWESDCSREAAFADTNNLLDWLQVAKGYSKTVFKKSLKQHFYDSFSS